MSLSNHSPWIDQLDDTIDYPAISTDEKADIVII